MHLPAGLRAATYDGDTAPGLRRAVRNDGNIVVTNPDMLHSGILPHHTSWVRLFQHLRYIVIDELHAYRGLFGSHLANVLRRLLRLCRFYGSNPTVIACSATIANPRELAEKLLERPVQLVDRNGAPRAARRLWFWNPPLVDGTMGVRRSATLEARRLMTELLSASLQTIAFTRSRCQRRGAAHLPAATAPRATPGWLVAGARLPWRLPAAGAPRHRGRAARRQRARRGEHQRARAGHRHRQPRCGHPCRLPGDHRIDVAAARPRRPPRQPSRWASSSPPIHRSTSSWSTTRTTCSTRPPSTVSSTPTTCSCSGSHLQAAAFELAFEVGRLLRSRRRRHHRRAARPLPRRRARSIAAARATTGRPMRSPPRRSRCAAPRRPTW